MSSDSSNDTVLILRTCDAQMRAHGGFVWPESGAVEAPDWRDDTKCGGGLHGFLWGEGASGLASWASDARWLVVAVKAADIRDLGGKVKFPRGVVVHCGDRASATQYLYAHGGAGRRIIGLALAGGDEATLTGGDGATLTGGYRATLIGGDRATLTGGDEATLTGGDGATLTGGYRATLTGGYRATLTGGDGATLTGGAHATLTGGHYANLTAYWWDHKANRRRVTTAYVGEDGIEAGVAYRCDKGKWVRADSAQ